MVKGPYLSPIHMGTSDERNKLIGGSLIEDGRNKLS